MSLTRLAIVAAVTAALTLAAGCGGTSAGPSQDPAASSLDPTSTVPVPTQAPEATASGPTPGLTPTVPQTRTPKPSPTAGGDGDAQGVHAPSTAGGGVCTHVGASQVGAILGVTVTGAAVPGETGCTFDQGGKRGMSVTVLDKSASAAGGMAGAKDEANSAVEGEPQDAPGIGSDAFVVTGSMFGGPDVNAAGAVQVGSRIISVYLTQRSGLDEAKVRGLELDLLRLVAQARSSHTSS